MESPLKKNYTICLDKEMVEEVKDIMNKRGSKLSPVINLFLIDWVNKNKPEDSRD